jgi:hypothetical protein
VLRTLCKRNVLAAPWHEPPITGGVPPWQLLMLTLVRRMKTKGAPCRAFCEAIWNPYFAKLALPSLNRWLREQWPKANTAAQYQPRSYLKEISQARSLRLHEAYLVNRRRSDRLGDNLNQVLFAPASGPYPSNAPAKNINDPPKREPLRLFR